MPEEKYWESLFDVSLILDRLKIGADIRTVGEFGCGYGTFAIPVAQRTGAIVYTFDIESAMVSRTRERSSSAGLSTVRAEVRDVFARGFGLLDESCDACLLFNILHCAEPETILRESCRIVRPAGRVLVIHWRADIITPRGPPLPIRPRPKDVRAWGRAAGLVANDPVELPPWHFGLTLTK